MTGAPEQDLIGLRIRQAVRALLVTPQREVLLVRFEFPTRTVWTLPGGGIDPGETPEQALRRELLEECGHDLDVCGPHVWSRLLVIPFEDGNWDGQRDQIHLVEVAQRFEPRPHMTWEQLNAEHVHELRWWSVEELAAATDVLIVPQRLAELVTDLLDNGPPNLPVDVSD